MLGREPEQGSAAPVPLSRAGSVPSLLSCTLGFAVCEGMVRTGPVCGSPGDALRLPWHRPSRRCPVPRLGQTSQAPRVQTMKERLCYLFPSKNQLLLNSCFSSQVFPLPPRPARPWINSFPLALWCPERRNCLAGAKLSFSWD